MMQAALLYIQTLMGHCIITAVQSVLGQRAGCAVGTKNTIRLSTCKYMFTLHNGGSSLNASIITE